MSKLLDQIREKILANPSAWVLFGMFLVAEYGNYQRGRELTRVCELTGPHDVASRYPKNDRDELDTICVNRQSDD